MCKNPDFKDKELYASLIFSQFFGPSFAAIKKIKNNLANLISRAAIVLDYFHVLVLFSD